MFDESEPAAPPESAPAGMPPMDDDVYDPLEPLNRGIFAFNEAVDIAVVAPTATVYQTVIPQPLRNNFRSFLRNLQTPITLTNNLLQGDWAAAETTAARFFINTTLGMGGFADVASSAGHPYQSADFGQTLGRWGVGPGLYMVRPFLGPSNSRDTFGWVVDTVADPVSIALTAEGAAAWDRGRTGLTLIDARSRVLGEVEELRASSVDTYATIRSLTSQMRMRQIRGTDASGYDLPTFDDFEDFGDDDGFGDTSTLAPSSAPVPSSLFGNMDATLLDGQQATLPSSHWLADTE